MGSAADGSDQSGHFGLDPVQRIPRSNHNRSDQLLHKDNRSFEGSVSSYLEPRPTQSHRRYEDVGSAYFEYWTPQRTANNVFVSSRRERWPCNGNYRSSARPDPCPAWLRATGYQEAHGYGLRKPTTGE